MPVKVKKAAQTKKAPRGKKPMGLTSALGPKATTMVVIVVIAGAIMVASRQQQAKAKERLGAAPADVVLTADPAAAKKDANTAAGATMAAPVVATTGVSAAAKAPITVSGCLERTDDGYRLKDTTGAEAPKARNWKSGFLKKSSATLDIVDAGRTLQLADHVGRRVSLTGMVTEREMRARSIRRLGECKAN
jgi:hypothetical protein